MLQQLKEHVEIESFNYSIFTYYSYLSQYESVALLAQFFKINRECAE